MKIGKKLSDEEWELRITPVIIRLFLNPDRAIRVCLLDNLPNMIDHLSQKVVNDKVFPQMVIPPVPDLQTLLTGPGLGLHRRSAIGSRADSQGRPDRHLKIV
jgi:hypothetical protein